jgi:hypothetical protein
LHALAVTSAQEITRFQIGWNEFHKLDCCFPTHRGKGLRHKQRGSGVVIATRRLIQGLQDAVRPGRNQGGSMRKSFASVIIMSTSSHRVSKLRLDRSTIALLMLGAAVLCLTFIALGYFLPPLVNDIERVRLEHENVTLRAQNKDLQMHTENLHTRVSNLEEKSKRVEDLMKSN